MSDRTFSEADVAKLLMDNRKGLQKKIVDQAAQIEILESRLSCLDSPLVRLVLFFRGGK